MTVTPPRLTATHWSLIFQCKLHIKLSQHTSKPTLFNLGGCDVRTYSGNGGGACCVFPFIYKGKKHYRCTTEDSNEDGFLGHSWCAVTDNYDRDEMRGLCVTENSKSQITFYTRPFSLQCLCIHLGAVYMEKWHAPPPSEPPGLNHVFLQFLISHRLLFS